MSVRVNDTKINIRGPQTVDGKEMWSTTKPYVLTTSKEDGEMPIPEGFEHDGASVPRMFWWLFPKLSKYAIAALFHDWFYRHKGQLPSGQVINRKRADAVFLELMLWLNVGRARAKTMHRMVRWFGPRW